MHLLVIGECGDGKSTLINILRDPSQGGEAATGKRARGVTKRIETYDGFPINGRPIKLLDTPGVGDMDVTPVKLISLLEAQLSMLHQPVHGVLMTSPISDSRIKLGAQVVKALVAGRKGILGPGKMGQRHPGRHKERQSGRR